MEINQIQASNLIHEDEEVLISIMDTMLIEDVDHMEIQQDSDWLGMDISALVCSTFISSQTTSHNKQTALQPKDNISSDLKPFAPDY